MRLNIMKKFITIYIQKKKHDVSMKSITWWRIGYFFVVFGFVFWAYAVTKAYGYSGIAIYCLGIIIGMALISGFGVKK